MDGHHKQEERKKKTIKKINFSIYMVVDFAGTEKKRDGPPLDVLLGQYRKGKEGCWLCGFLDSGFRCS